MKTLLPLVLTLAALSPVLRADSWDRDRNRNDRGRGSGRVIVYEHAGFSGASLELYPGDAIDNMSGKSFSNGGKLNDRISSIRIEGDVEVFVYDDARFSGSELRLDESARDLTMRFVAGSVNVNWNDRISSMRVERPRGGRRDDDRGHDNNGPKVDVDKVIKLTFQEMLGRDPNDGEYRDLRGRFRDSGWNERMLRDYLRNDNRYRTEVADRIIYRVYRELLDRNPDENGLKNYRYYLIEKRWTENDLRDAVRKSPEYQERNPRK